MTTIPDIMKIISRDIQSTFEELIKLLIRKSLRPVLNPLGTNTKVVYNNFKGKYERGFIGSSPDDNISKYSYIMTHDSLGWTEEVLVNFKVMAKFIKNNTIERFPIINTKKHNSIKPRRKIAFSDRENKQFIFNIPSNTQYKNFLYNLSSRNIQNIIANRKASSIYTTDVPYTHSFKELELVGKDIIDQTDPSICAQDSAKMSTSMLRAKLHNLETLLANLSIEHPNIYDAYIEMIRIINCISKNKIIWVINLIAALTYQRWSDLSKDQKQLYLESLGEDFIYAFNDNELITILLQSGFSEIILTSSYLYPLLKMLFLVFGYSKLVPLVTDDCNEEKIGNHRNNMRKHFEKYKGASYRRGDDLEMVYNAPEPHWSNDCYIDEQGNPVRTIKRNIILSGDQDHYDPMASPSTEIYDADIEPFDQYIYDYIRLFGDLYPTIIELMGGTESFPPETIKIGCHDIPPTYDYLASIQEYLWRFNDYSYCRYLEYIASKQLDFALNAKVNSKARYLNSI